MQELDQTRTEDVTGGAIKRPPMTTMAVGEEGTTFTFSEDITSLGFGEEGCIPPRIPMLSASALGSF
jgi:hypothetical protein